MKIAIAGNAGAGKSTVAKQLVERYGYTRMALATPLKELCALHNDREKWWTIRAHLDGLIPGASSIEGALVARRVWSAFETIPVVDGKNRRLLQVVGTDILRTYNPNVWVDYLLRWTEGKDFIVVDDVRFVNEFKGLAAAGWRMVLCAAPHGVRAARLEADYGRPLTDEERNHPSERDLDTIPMSSWDWVLNTAGSMCSQRVKVDEMMRYLMESEVAGVSSTPDSVLEVQHG